MGTGHVRNLRDGNRLFTRLLDLIVCFIASQEDIAQYTALYHRLIALIIFCDCSIRFIIQPFVSQHPQVQPSLNLISTVAHGFAGPSCSANHLPGYINSPKLKNIDRVFVVSVNDPFVCV